MDRRIERAGAQWDRSSQATRTSRGTSSTASTTCARSAIPTASSARARLFADASLQALLCNADITLEPGQTVKKVMPNGKVHTEIAGGYDVVHQCRDWRQVWNYMEDEWKRSFPDSNPMAYAAMNGQA